MDQRDRETLESWLAEKNEEEKSLIRVFITCYNHIIRQIERENDVLGGGKIKAQKVIKEMSKIINKFLPDLFCELFNLKNITLNPEMFAVIEELFTTPKE